jgi:hypothetical protein
MNEHLESERSKARDIILSGLAIVDSARSKARDIILSGLAIVDSANLFQIAERHGTTRQALASVIGELKAEGLVRIASGRGPNTVYSLTTEGANAAEAAFLPEPAPNPVPEPVHAPARVMTIDERLDELERLIKAGPEVSRGLSATALASMRRTSSRAKNALREYDDAIARINAGIRMILACLG